MEPDPVDEIEKTDPELAKRMREWESRYALDSAAESQAE
jgi:hypothetical protein